MRKGVILGKNKVRNDLWLSEHVYIYTPLQKKPTQFYIFTGKDIVLF